ncbi:hypothetical protein GCM10009603_27190 [Nocardiopsis exhalans]
MASGGVRSIIPSPTAAWRAPLMAIAATAPLVAPLSRGRRGGDFVSFVIVWLRRSWFSVYIP